MSLVRTALRLLVVEALKNATIAGGRVFDSLMEDLSPDTFANGDEAPTMIVTTDKDEGQQLSEQNGGPPFARSMELNIEMGMTRRVRSESEGDLILYPNTDARLEAALDLFEFQAVQHLQLSQNDAAVLFRRFFRIIRYDSHRQVFDETGTLIACRVLTLECYGSDDRVSVYNTQETMPTGYNKFPSQLRAAAELLSSGSSGRSICDLLAAGINNFTLPPLEGFDAQVKGSTEDEGGPEMVDVTLEISSARSVHEYAHTGGALQIDYQKGTTQKIILAGDVTAMSIIGWPRAGVTGRLVLHVTQMGNFSIDAWPATTLWTNNGDQPVVSVGTGKRDAFVLWSADGGIEFFANIVGRDYAS